MKELTTEQKKEIEIWQLMYKFRKMYQRGRWRPSYSVILRKYGLEWIIEASDHEFEMGLKAEKIFMKVRDMTKIGKVPPASMWTNLKSAYSGMVKKDGKATCKWYPIYDKLIDMYGIDRNLLLTKTQDRDMLDIKRVTDVCEWFRVNGKVLPDSSSKDKHERSVARKFIILKKLKEGARNHYGAKWKPVYDQVLEEYGMEEWIFCVEGKEQKMYRQVIRDVTGWVSDKGRLPEINAEDMDEVKMYRKIHNMKKGRNPMVRGGSVWNEIHEDELIKIGMQWMLDMDALLPATG